MSKNKQFSQPQPHNTQYPTQTLTSLPATSDQRSQPVSESSHCPCRRTNSSVNHSHTTHSILHRHSHLFQQLLIKEVSQSQNPVTAHVEEQTVQSTTATQHTVYYTNTHISSSNF